VAAESKSLAAFDKLRLEAAARAFGLCPRGNVPGVLFLRRGVAHEFGAGHDVYFYFIA
jgi:hypothetical protein